MEEVKKDLGNKKITVSIQFKQGVDQLIITNNGQYLYAKVKYSIMTLTNNM